jgi:hypothetical protein
MDTKETLSRKKWFIFVSMLKTLGSKSFLLAIFCKFYSTYAARSYPPRLLGHVPTPPRLIGPASVKLPGSISPRSFFSLLIMKIFQWSVVIPFLKMCTNDMINKTFVVF